MGTNEVQILAMAAESAKQCCIMPQINSTFRCRKTSYFRKCMVGKAELADGNLKIVKVYSLKNAQELKEKPGSLSNSCHQSAMISPALP